MYICRQSCSPYNVQATSEAELTHAQVQQSEILIIIKCTVAKVTNSSEGK